MTRDRILLCAVIAASLALSGCAAPHAPRDDSAFRAARPATLLVLPPVSEAPDVKASPAVWAHATRPLAEAGYYVLPVTAVDETFRQNGVSSPEDAAGIAPAKLRDVFGADAVVQITVKKYGTSYSVIASETRVEVEARIVDLRSGVLLWEGRASASSQEEQRQSNGIIGVLVSAALNQIIGTATDAAAHYAEIADARLLALPVAGPRARPKESPR